MDEYREMDDKLYEGRSSCAIAKSLAPALALRKTESALSLSLSLSTFFRGTPVKASTLQWAGQHRQGKGRSRQARRAGAPSLVSSAPSPSPSHGTHLALLDPSFPMAVQYTARYALAIILGSLGRCSGA